MLISVCMLYIVDNPNLCSLKIVTLNTAWLFMRKRRNNRFIGKLNTEQAVPKISVRLPVLSYYSLQSLASNWDPILSRFKIQFICLLVNRLIITNVSMYDEVTPGNHQAYS